MPRLNATVPMKTILVVDDEASIVEAVTEVLAEAADEP